MVKLESEPDMPDMEARALTATTCCFLIRLDQEFSIQGFWFPRTFGNVWTHFRYGGAWERTAWLLLNFLHHSGRSPTATNFLVQTVIVLRLRNTGWGETYLLPEAS